MLELFFKKVLIPPTKSYDSHESYTFIDGDVRDTDLMVGLASDCDHLIAGAAMIGGISYFHNKRLGRP